MGALPRSMAIHRGQHARKTDARTRGHRCHHSAGDPACRVVRTGGPALRRDLNCTRKGGLREVARGKRPIAAAGASTRAVTNRAVLWIRLGRKLSACTTVPALRDVIFVGARIFGSISARSPSRRYIPEPTVTVRPRRGQHAPATLIAGLMKCRFAHLTNSQPIAARWLTKWARTDTNSKAPPGAAVAGWNVTGTRWKLIEGDLMNGRFIRAMMATGIAAASAFAVIPVAATGANAASCVVADYDQHGVHGYARTTDISGGCSKVGAQVAFSVPGISSTIWSGWVYGGDVATATAPTTGTWAGSHHYPY